MEFKRGLTTTLARGKLVIFTEFADTARYLADRIKEEVDPKTLLFSSASSPEFAAPSSPTSTPTSYRPAMTIASLSQQTFSQKA